jgi:hypothetical protein
MTTTTTQAMWPVRSDVEWFRLWRVLFGLYVTYYVAIDLPFLDEMFTTAGTLVKEGRYVALLPGTPRDTVRAVWLVAVVAGSLVTLGVARRPAALMLWLCLCVFDDANVAVRTPEQPHVKLALLLLVALPGGEGTPWQKPRADFVIDDALRAVMWLSLVGMNLSAGVTKLLYADDSWADGTALRFLLDSHAGWRRAYLGDLFDRAPDVVIAAGTWFSMAVELLGVVCVLHPRARRGWWTASLAMHIGISLLLNIAQVSFGMILTHLFLLRVEWLPSFVRTFRIADLHRTIGRRALALLALIDLWCRAPLLTSLYSDDGVLPWSALHATFHVVPAFLTVHGDVTVALGVLTVGVAAAVVLLLEQQCTPRRLVVARTTLAMALAWFSLRNPWAVVDGDALLLFALVVVRDGSPRKSGAPIFIVFAASALLRVVTVLAHDDGACIALLSPDRALPGLHPALACGEGGAALAVVVGLLTTATAAAALAWRGRQRRAALAVLVALAAFPAVMGELWRPVLVVLAAAAPMWSLRSRDDEDDASPVPPTTWTPFTTAAVVIALGIAPVRLVFSTSMSLTTQAWSGFDAAAPPFVPAQRGTGWITVPLLVDGHVVDAARDGLPWTREMPVDLAERRGDERTRAVERLLFRDPPAALSRGLIEATCRRAARFAALTRDIAGPPEAVRVVAHTFGVDDDGVVSDVVSPRIVASGTCPGGHRAWPPAGKLPAYTNRRGDVVDEEGRPVAATSRRDQSPPEDRKKPDVSARDASPSAR